MPYRPTKSGQPGGMNVLGSQPMPGQQPQEGQAVPGAQVAGAVSGIEQSQTAPQQPTIPKSQQGSGMFRDLRKYVQSNTPQAEKMGQAITQNTGEQAKQIGEQVNQRQQKLQQQIQENQSRIEEQKQFGQQQIQQAVQAPAEIKDPNQDAESLKRFRDIVTGVENYQNVDALDTGSQQAAAARIEQLGKMAERTPARRQLLQDTFSQTGSYQGGQKTLDDLILQAGGAIGGIKQGVTAQGQGALQNIRDAQGQARQKQADLINFRNQAVSGLTEGVTAGQGQVTQSISTRAAQKQAETNALLEGLKSGELTAEQASELGLKEGDILFGQSGTGTGMDAAASNDYLIGLANKLGVSIDQLISNKAGLGGIDYNQILGGVKAKEEDVMTQADQNALDRLAALSGKTRDTFINQNIGGYDTSRAAALQQLKDSISGARTNFNETASNIAKRNASYDLARQNWITPGSGSVYEPQLAANKDRWTNRINTDASGNFLSASDPLQGSGGLAQMKIAESVGITPGTSTNEPGSRHIVKRPDGGYDIVEMVAADMRIGQIHNQPRTIGQIGAQQAKDALGGQNENEYNNKMFQDTARSGYNEAFTNIQQSLRPQTLRIKQAQQAAAQAAQDGGIMRSKQSQARRQALQGMAQRERYIK